MGLIFIIILIFSFLTFHIIFNHAYFLKYLYILLGPQWTHLSTYHLSWFHLEIWKYSWEDPPRLLYSLCPQLFHLINLCRLCCALRLCARKNNLCQTCKSFQVTILDTSWGIFSYMGGTRQEGKRPKKWEFYPLCIGFSWPLIYFLLCWKLSCVWSI